MTKAGCQVHKLSKIHAGLQEIQQVWHRYQIDLEHFVASFIGVGLAAIFQRHPERALQLQNYFKSLNVQWFPFAANVADNASDNVIGRILKDRPLVAQEILLRVAVPMAEMIDMARRIQLDLRDALCQNTNDINAMLISVCASFRKNYLNDSSFDLFSDYMSHVQTLIHDLNDLLGAAYEWRDFKFPPLALRFSIINLVGEEVNLDDLVKRQVLAPAIIQTDNGMMLYVVSPNDRQLIMLEAKVSRAIKSLIGSGDVSILSVSLLEHSDIYRALKSNLSSQLAINQKSWTDLIMMPAQRYSTMVASINELSVRIDHADLLLLKKEIEDFSSKINKSVKEQKFELTSSQCSLTWLLTAKNNRFGVSQLGKLPGVVKLNRSSSLFSFFKPETVYCVKSHDHEFKLHHQEGAWHIQLAEQTQTVWRMSADSRLAILAELVSLARSLKSDDFDFSDLRTLPSPISEATRQFLNLKLARKSSAQEHTDDDDFFHHA